MIIELDHHLFKLVNQTWSHPGLDPFFILITDLHKSHLFAFFFVLAMILALYRRFQWKLYQPLLLVICALGTADAIGGQILKPFFGRLRPPLVLEDVVQRTPQFGGYSFPSNHATNIFCLAVLLCFFFPKARWWFLAFAALVAYSRVYNGVHFPADVVFGGIWGAILGLLFIKIFSKIKTFMNKTKNQPQL